MTAAYDHRDDMALHTTCETVETGRVVDFVKAHEQKHGALPPAKFYLSGPEPGERVELTKDLFEVLKAAASHLRAGRSVSLHAQDQEITTQQAADLLGLSRPTVVELVKQGVLSAQVPGKTRRKLKLAEVLEYKDRLREDRSEFIASSSQEFAEFAADRESAKKLFAEARRAKQPRD